LQVQNIKREYERLQKRYSKHKKDSEREKEKSTLEINDGVQEVHRLTKKVEVSSFLHCLKFTSS